MKKTSLLCALLLALISCNKFVSISKNEDNGIKEVLDFFGGTCEYSIGASYSSNEGSKKYFELKISKSDVVEKYTEAPEVASSNVAYTFYKNLKNETKKYDEIHVILIF